MSMKDLRANKTHTSFQQFYEQPLIPKKPVDVVGAVDVEILDTSRDIDSSYRPTE
jgi:hypothetical protein